MGNMGNNNIGNIVNNNMNSNMNMSNRINVPYSIKR